jgi:glyoxylase-like metal-dependent hydrolase (beta-lactamase superfamily II)
LTDIRSILAPNPGPFTLEGTNTWIVGSNPTLVIDPGPEDAGHVEAVARAAGHVEAILLTHHHPDHAPGAGLLAGITGSPVLAFEPWSGEQALRHGQIVRAGSASLTAVHTPGHTRDHLVFHDPEARSLFTGDAVLGRGTSVVDPSDGDLGAYLESLRRMLRLEPDVLYPGHGPVVHDGRRKLEEYLRHRDMRERQVLAGLAGGPRTPSELVPGIYFEYPKDLHPVAARTVLAHLLKLERDGRVARVGGPPEDRFELTVVSGPAEPSASSGESSR